jgi:hypothetical protein
MKALSILQPYAWLILRPDITDPGARAYAYQRGDIKDIENREWYSKLRGRIYVHAGKRYTRDDHGAYTEEFAEDFGIQLPAYADLPRGGIVGTVEIVDCVREHPSRWKMFGTWGFVLRDAQPLAFRPFRGQLNFFDVPEIEPARA